MRQAILILVGVAFFCGVSVVLAGTLTCNVTTTCSGGTVIFKIFDTNGGHAELPTQSNYPQLVCCSGVASLGNSCASSTNAVVLNLQGPTNSHVEENTFSDYLNPVCLSIGSGGTVTTTYQAGNCAGYDTTLASIASNTNSHVGSPAAYNLQVCASAASNVTCSTNIGSTAFGTLSGGAVATSVPNASTTISCSDGLGCALYVNDAGNGVNAGLATTSPAYLIPSATGSLVAGTEGYGIQATTTATGSGGILGISATYLKTGNAVGGLDTANVLLTSSTATITNREVVVTHLAAIKATTQAGNYADTITYSCVGN